MLMKKTISTTSDEVTALTYLSLKCVYSKFKAKCLQTKFISASSITKLLKI